MSYFYTFAQTWAIKRKCGKIRILKELKKLTINLWKKKKKVNREYYAIERNSLPCMERYLITNQNFLLTPSHMNWNQKRVVLCHWGTLFGCRYRSMNKTAEIKLWRYRQLGHLRILSARNIHTLFVVSSKTWSQRSTKKFIWC